MKYIKPIESKEIEKNETSSLKDFKNYVNEHYMEDEFSDEFADEHDMDDDYIDEDDMENAVTYGDDIVEFKIPEWALSALINGDYSGLSDEDEVKINDFVAKTVEQFGNANFMLADDLDKDKYYGFCHSNDIDDLGSNCEKLLLKADKGI